MGSPLSGDTFSPQEVQESDADVQQMQGIIMDINPVVNNDPQNVEIELDNDVEEQMEMDEVEN
jgi:hypothetical protein